MHASEFCSVECVAENRPQRSERRDLRECVAEIARKRLTEFCSVQFDEQGATAFPTAPTPGPTRNPTRVGETHSPTDGSGADGGMGWWIVVTEMCGGFRNTLGMPEVGKRRKEENARGTWGTWGKGKRKRTGR